MPIEIKELYIKINVKEGPNKESSGDSNKGKDDAVSVTVEEVMELLQKQKER